MVFEVILVRTGLHVDLAECE